MNKKQYGSRIHLLKWPGLGKISCLSDWNRELMPQVFVLRLRLPARHNQRHIESTSENVYMYIDVDRSPTMYSAKP